MAKVSAPVQRDGEWDRVPIMLIKDNGKYKSDLFVSVNGYRYLIPRGVEVKVPRFIFVALMESMSQDRIAAEFIDRQSSDSAARLKAIGE